MCQWLILCASLSTRNNCPATRINTRTETLTLWTHRVNILASFCRPNLAPERQRKCTPRKLGKNKKSFLSYLHPDFVRRSLSKMAKACTVMDYRQLSWIIQQLLCGQYFVNTDRDQVLEPFPVAEKNGWQRVIVSRKCGVRIFIVGMLQP